MATSADVLNVLLSGAASIAVVLLIGTAFELYGVTVSTERKEPLSEEEVSRICNELERLQNIKAMFHPPNEEKDHDVQ